MIESLPLLGCLPSLFSAVPCLWWSDRFGRQQLSRASCWLSTLRCPGQREPTSLPGHRWSGSSSCDTRSSQPCLATNSASCKRASHRLNLLRAGLSNVPRALEPAWRWQLLCWGNSRRFVLWFHAHSSASVVKKFLEKNYMTRMFTGDGENWEFRLFHEPGYFQKLFTWTIVTLCMRASSFFGRNLVSVWIALGSWLDGIWICGADENRARIAQEDADWRPESSLLDRGRSLTTPSLHSAAVRTRSKILEILWGQSHKENAFVGFDDS